MEIFLNKYIKDFFDSTPDCLYFGTIFENVIKDSSTEDNVLFIPNITKIINCSEDNIVNLYSLKSDAITQAKVEIMQNWGLIDDEKEYYHYYNEKIIIFKISIPKDIIVYKGDCPGEWFIHEFDIQCIAKKYILENEIIDISNERDEYVEHLEQVENKILRDLRKKEYDTLTLKK